MAKNKVEIDVEVKDKKGSTKKMALESKNAAKGLDDVGKGARTADRNIKGAAQASANGTKNFSKMAQGTGGLVGAYATLAANIFAVTAAFSFLKSAADYRVVQEAQIAFTGATGQGMRTLTADIQAASDSMLNFQAASEAASIGIASGLSAGQITELSAGASNLSKILGRDVTDSFNRLVRGVTKAEPELLDELGITLRLADAQENYATSLNKTAKDLSNFEKKQAVFAEVQDQLESKYNAVANATDIQANAMDKLAVAFDKVLHPIKDFVAILAEPAAEFFSKNVKSFGIALGLLAVPLIKQIIPGLDGFAQKAEESAQRASEAFKQTKIDIDELAQTRAAASRDPIGAGKTALAGVQTKEGTGARAMQEGGVLTKRQLAAMKRSAKQGVGIVKNMTKQQKTAYLAAIDAMIRGDKKLGMSLKNTMVQIETTTKITAKKMQVIWQSTMSFMGKAASKMGKAVNGIMKALGFIGILIMLKDMAQMALEAMGLLEANKAVEAYAEKLDNLTSRLKDTNKEFEKFAEMQLALRKQTNGTFAVRTIEGIAAIGKMIDQVAPDILAMNELLEKPVTYKVVGKTVESITGKQVHTIKERRALIQQMRKENKTYMEQKKILDGFLTESMAEYKRAKREIGSDDGGLIERMITKDPDTVAANEALQKNLKTTIAGLKATGMASTKAGAEYLQLLGQMSLGEKLTDKQKENFKNLSEALSESGQKASFAKIQQKELTKQYTQQMNAVTMFITPQTQLVKLLEDQKKTLEELDDYEGRSVAIEDLNTQIRLTKMLRDITIGFKNEQAKLNAITAKAIIGATPLQKAEVERTSKLLSLDIKRNEILKKMNLVADGKLTLDENQKEAYTQQLALLNAQTEELERQNELTLQLRDNMMSAMEGATSTGIADLIKGKEGSFKDTILKIAQSTLEAAADTLAQSMTKGIFGKLFETPAQKMERAHREGGEAAAKMIKAAIEGKKIGSSDTVEGSISKSVSEDGKLIVDEIVATGDKGGFINALKDIFNPETPFLNGLKGIFKSALNGFDAVIGGLIDSIFGGGTSGGFFDAIFSIFARDGGVFSGGKKVQSYATGGVARGSTSGYPAVLHGTEAVVPLGSGNSIPVEMKGGGNVQNNVVVNVSTDGTSRTESSSGMDADRMGQAVAAAVQAELQNQKRSGGILNPYGVA